MAHIIHLVDDTNNGGVMRLLRTLEICPDLAEQASHEVVPVRRGFVAPPRLDATIIVSHLSVSWRGLPGLIALRAACPQARLIHVEHSYSRAFAALNVTAMARFLTLLRTTYSLFDTVVAVSEDQAKWLLQREIVEPEALRVIPSAVDPTPFLQLPSPRAGPSVIGAVGRFDRQKGFDILIRAFRKIAAPTLELRMIGDGPERAHLEALAEGDPRICFTGFAADPAAALAGIDALAVPSRWEPFGLVALEGRAAGRPVLVAQIDGLRDQASAGAVAVRGHGPDVWREALESLITGEARADLAAVRRDASGAWRRFAAGWKSLCAEHLAPGNGKEDVAA